MYKGAIRNPVSPHTLIQPTSYENFLNQLGYRYDQALFIVGHNVIPDDGFVFEFYPLSYVTLGFRSKAGYLLCEDGKAFPVQVSNGEAVSLQANECFLPVLDFVARKIKITKAVRILASLLTCRFIIDNPVFSISYSSQIIDYIFTQGGFIWYLCNVYHIEEYCALRRFWMEDAFRFVKIGVQALNYNRLYCLGELYRRLDTGLSVSCEGEG